MPASLRRSLLERRPPAVDRQRRRGRARTPPSSAARALEAENGGARRPRRDQFERRRAPAPRPRSSRLRHPAAFRAPIGTTRLRLLRCGDRRRRRGHAARPRLAQRRHLERSRQPRRRSAGRAGERAVARLNPTRPRPGKYPVLFDPRVVGSRCSGISHRRDQRLVGRAQDQLPPGPARRSRCSRRASRSSTIRCDRAACARGRSMPRACASPAGAGRRAACSPAGSRKARRRGSSESHPTGHAVARRGGAPGAPQQPLHGAGSAQPRGAARGLSRSGAGRSS